MKTKPQPKRGNRIVAITSYCRSKQYNSETLHEVIYYVDTKRQIIWEEYGMEISQLVNPKQPYGSLYKSWPLRQKSRSLKALVAKYHSDFARFSSMFSDYDIQVEEIGVL